MKRWKVALSLAVIAAIAVPALAGTWQLDPGKWVALTKSDKDDIYEELRLINCADLRVDPGDKFPTKSDLCVVHQIELAKRLGNGGYWSPPPERFTWEHVVKNLRVAASAFGLTFMLVMVLPVIARRYWQWLRR
jgi:hypothetical protein